QSASWRLVHMCIPSLHHLLLGEMNANVITVDGSVMSSVFVGLGSVTAETAITLPIDLPYHTILLRLAIPRFAVSNPLKTRVSKRFPQDDSVRQALDREAVLPLPVLAHVVARRLPRFKRETAFSRPRFKSSTTSSC